VGKGFQDQDRVMNAKTDAKMDPYIDSIRGESIIESTSSISKVLEKQIKELRDRGIDVTDLEKRLEEAKSSQREAKEALEKIS